MRVRFGPAIIIRRSGRIDWTYVRTQLAPLAELQDAPEILDQLERRRVDREIGDRPSD